jgi:hypothetical protein
MKPSVRAIFLFVLITTAMVSFGLAQAPPVFTHATSANSWMTATVSPWLRPQVVSPILRRARDAYFDELIGKESPLTPESARGSYISAGAFVGIPPDVPDVENRQVLIGTFVSYQPILSQSKRSIYTEVAFQAEQILQQATTASLSNKSLTVIVPGGTVVGRDGSLLSFMTNPRHEFIAPTKRYLLVLSYHLDGDFNMLMRAWDVSSGTARPGFNSANSKFIGLSIDRILPMVRARLGIQ